MKDNSVVIEIGPNIKIWQKYTAYSSIFSNMTENEYYDMLAEELIYGGNPTKIFIKDRWFDVIPLKKLFGLKNREDGYYRFIYVQINTVTGEYYVGKVNRKTWREIKRYNGSGLKFTKKFEKHSEDFIQYFIASCKTAEETEQLEAEIVDDDLLKDPLCLNLVKGGGGTNKHNSEIRNQHIREYMISHPENFSAMLIKNKKLYCSGSSEELKKRNERIRIKMQDEHYREMSRERFKRWREEHPEEYVLAREKNKQAIQTEASKRKRNESIKKWRSEHQEEYFANKQKQQEACHTVDAERKRGLSLKKYNGLHPEIAKKRAEKAAEKLQKAVDMLDLVTGEIIRSFKSQQEAALWLVEQGIAKNTNCKSSISSVCLKKKCTTGYGYRKKAYGYGWQFSKLDNYVLSNDID